MSYFSGWYDAPPPHDVGDPDDPLSGTGALPQGGTGLTANRNTPEPTVHGTASRDHNDHAQQLSDAMDAYTSNFYPEGLGTGISAVVADQLNWGMDCAQLFLQWNLRFVPTYHPNGIQVPMPPDAVAVEWAGPTEIVGTPNIRGAWRNNLADNNLYGIGPPTGDPPDPPREMSSGAFCARVTPDSYYWDEDSSFGSENITPVTGELHQTIAKLSTYSFIDTMAEQHYLEYDPYSVNPWQLLNGDVPVDEYGFCVVAIGPSIMFNGHPAYEHQGALVTVSDVTRLEPGNEVAPPSGMPRLAFTVQESQYRFVFDEAGIRHPLRQLQRRW